MIAIAIAVEILFAERASEVKRLGAESAARSDCPKK